MRFKQELEELEKCLHIKITPYHPILLRWLKGLGSGIPIGATIIKKNISKIFQKGFHGSTYGGGMLQTRIALNVFNFINKKTFLNSILLKYYLLVCQLKFKKNIWIKLRKLE